MAVNEIVINRGEGGLGNPLPGEDYISGIVFYLANANLPSGFTTSDRIKQVASIAETEALGITKGSATNGVLWYHIDQFFKANPKGILYIGIFDNTSVDLSKIEDVQTFANGKIRQIGVFDTTTFATSAVTSLQTSANNLQNLHQPLNVIYAGDISGVSDLSTLTDLRTLNSKNVSVVIGQDGDADGKALFVSEGYSITTLGATLGTISKAAVNESIAWIRAFNIVQGSEHDVPAFANGDLYRDKKSLESGIDSKGYIYIKNFTGVAGAYHSDSYTSTLVTSDFATIENNRTIDKAVRGIRTFMLPNLSGPLVVDANSGKLSQDTIDAYKKDKNRAL